MWHRSLLEHKIEEHDKGLRELDELAQNLDNFSEDRDSVDSTALMSGHNSKGNMIKHVWWIRVRARVCARVRDSVSRVLQRTELSFGFEIRYLLQFLVTPYYIILISDSYIILNWINLHVKLYRSESVLEGQ